MEGQLIIGHNIVEIVYEYTPVSHIQYIIFNFT